MKKVISVLLALCTAFGILAGCGDEKADKVQVYMPDGAPAVSMAKMIHDGYANTQFNVVAPANIGTYVLSGKADLAVMPTNAAANVSGKADIAMIAVTNFGSLYLVGNGDPVIALSDLVGKVVYSIGQGNVPDLVFRILLQASEVPYVYSETAVADKVSLAYVSEGTEFIAGMKAGKMAYGIISEPAATVAQGNVEGAKRMLNIQTLYASLVGGEGYPQAALVVRKAFLEKNRAYVEKFVAAFKSGVKWAEEAPDDALTAIKSAGSTAVPKLTANIAKGCNLGFTWAADAKVNLIAFYERLKLVAEEGETPVGATLPADDFYLSAF